jgi:hypothetical protein
MIELQGERRGTGSLCLRSDCWMDMILVDMVTDKHDCMLKCILGLVVQMIVTVVLRWRIVLRSHLCQRKPGDAFTFIKQECQERKHKFIRQTTRLNYIDKILKTIYIPSEKHV